MNFTGLALTEPIVYSHPDFWGRKSTLTLKPSKHIEWMWSPTGSSTPIVINTKCVSTERHRIQLISHGKRLEVFEHIGVLRYGGLMGITLQGSGWTPYHGRALELLHMVR